MAKPKKAGVNEKAAEAKQAKESKKNAHKEASNAAAEDANWAAAGDGKVSKGPLSPIQAHTLWKYNSHTNRGVT